MKLIVAIPEGWEDARSQVAWALMRPDKTIASEGEGPLRALPTVKRATVVVPASRVLLTAATLPAADDNTRLFLPRAGAPRRWTVF